MAWRSLGSNYRSSHEFMMTMNRSFTEKEAAFWESGFRGHKPIVCPRHPRYQGECVGYVRNILSIVIVVRYYQHWSCLTVIHSAPPHPNTATNVGTNVDTSLCLESRYGWLGASFGECAAAAYSTLQTYPPLVRLLEASTLVLSTTQ